MKINLLELSQKEDYETVECSFGKIKVYHTPEPMIWAIIPGESLPVHPTVEMKTATGHIQSRLAKLGDKEYEVYLAAKSKYDELLNDLQLAARYVFALKEVDYPDLNEPPSRLKESGLTYPENELLRKKAWLDYTVLSKVSDLSKIQSAMMKLNQGDNPTPDQVDEIKKNSD